MGKVTDQYMTLNRWQKYQKEQIKSEIITFSSSDEEKGDVCPGGDRERRVQSAGSDLISLGGKG